MSSRPYPRTAEVLAVPMRQVTSNISPLWRNQELTRPWHKDDGLAILAEAAKAWAPNQETPSLFSRSCMALIDLSLHPDKCIIANLGRDILCVLRLLVCPELFLAAQSLERRMSSDH